MRRILYIFLTFFVLGVFIILFAFINQDKLIDRFVERQSRGIEFRHELLSDMDNITLITIGTGSPLPSKRIQPCNAIIAGGQLLIFDAGEGSVAMIEDLKLPIDRISAVFISHWHSDHYIDLPNLVNRSWQLGRNYQFTVYGPRPVDTIVSSLNSFLAPETGFRMLHHGPDIMNADSARCIAAIVNPHEDVLDVIYEKNGVKVSAGRVDHFPVDISLCYVIEYKGKKIVLSGDTNKSTSLVRFASEADILVHDAMQKDFISRAARLQDKLGHSRNAQIARHIQNYHASPLDAAEVARDANVKKLILSHLSPVPENPVSRRFYTLGLDKIFKGPIILAEDGDVFQLKS